MCGPPDFAALETCIIRLAGLSAAGLGTYAVCQTASLCRKLGPKREKQEERASQVAPARLAAEGHNGHPSA